MSIPAVVPPPPPPPPQGLPPDFLFGGIRATLDDSQGSGVTITLGTVDVEYVQWRLTKLEGWDSASLDEGAQNRTGADGAWDTANFYGARVVELGGLIVAPDAATAERARTRLEQAVPPRRTVTLTVGEPTPKQVACRRSGRLLLDQLTDVTTQFSVSLLAVDPRKYAAAESSASGSLGAPGGGLLLPTLLPTVFPEHEAGGEFFSAVNAGTWETPPLIRIVGPGRNLGVANLTTGQSLRYPFALAPGDELLVDTLAGAAQLNGTAYRAPSAGSTVTSRFLLQPGTNAMQMLGERTDAAVTPLLTMTWRSAWM